MTSLTNTIVCIPQMYIISLLFCKFRKLKYDYSISFAITLSIQIMIYVLNDYWEVADHSLALSFIISTIGSLLTAFLIFEGSVVKKLLGALFVFGLVMVIERISTMLGIAVGVVELSMGTVTDDLVIGRNIFNSIMYACYILLEMLYNRKKSRKMFRMMVCSFLVAVAEVSILTCMVHVTKESIVDHLLSFVTIYSVVVFLGHQITMEFIQRNIEYQEKQNELEQKALERKYQYDYYLLAKQQGEEIRDIRHDMRNQLQTIQIMLQADKAEDRQRAEQMLLKLRQKVRQPLWEDN